MRHTQIYRHYSKQPTLSLSRFVHAALVCQQALVCWRAPMTGRVQALACKPESIAKNEDLRLKHGFLLAPFAISSSKESSWLPADFYFDASEPKGFQYNEFALTEAEVDSFRQACTGQPIGTFYDLAGMDNYYATQIEYENLVQECVQHIRDGVFAKAVTSRAAFYSQKTDFNILAAFEELERAYPHAFVCLLSIPGMGTWLCASPETLLSTDSRGFFRTMALAGTQPKANFASEKEVTWRQKEIEEQAMVSRYIINCFKQIRLREFEEIGPKTRFAANLAHLCSEFRVDMGNTNFWELPSVMLELLHPTSAVCGLPQKPALAFLSTNEKHNRRLYSGYLGYVGEDAMHLFVMLRCMQVIEKGMILYAGGGIVEDSEPFREWEETQHKMNTLLNVVR